MDSMQTARRVMARRSSRRGWGWIRRLPSGRYQASYVGPDLMRHRAPTTFTLKGDAEHWVTTERRLIEQQAWTPPTARTSVHAAQVITLDKYATRWIEQRNVKERTRIHYRSMMDRHISPVLGHSSLPDLSNDTVRSWFASLDPSHPVIAAQAYTLLHAILATAVSDGLIPANPCAIPKATRAPRVHEPVILTVPEVAKLADAIEPQFKALILIAAWCGLRFGEVTELRRKDVGIGCKTISVSRAVTHRGQCRVGTPKSGRMHTVVVPPHIRPDIGHHLSAYVAQGPNAQLFPPAAGCCHIRDTSFRRRFNAALAAIGREGVHIHDLRHFAGTMAARVGNLPEIMARLDHSTVSASIRYQSQVSGRAEEVAEALSQFARAPHGE